MIILGIDPGIAAGKPLAIVTVGTDELRVIADREWREEEVLGAWGSGLWRKFGQWRGRLLVLEMLRQPDLIVIEDSRGVGGKGSAHLQALVTLLKEQAEGLGVSVILVNPQEAKAAVAMGRGGRRTKKWVATGVRLLVDCSELPDGYDWTDAVAVALAGEQKWREQKLKGGE